MSLRPSESFERIMRFVRLISSCVGFNVYDKSYRMNKVTAFALLAIFVYCVFTTITVIGENNWMFTLQALVLGSFLGQCVNKLYIAIRYPQKVRTLNESVIAIYSKFENHTDHRFARDLLECCERLRLGVIIVGVSYFVGVSGMIIFPISVSLLTDKFTLIMHFHIPGISVATKTGAWITQVVHAVTLILGGVGLFAGDLLIIVHLMQSYVYVAVLRLKIDIFNTFVEEPGTRPATEIQNMLVDMIQFHQEYLTFISRCNDLFYSIVSIQVFSAAASIIMTIFVMLTSDWPSGYFFVFVLIPNLYTYCIVGTLVEICNEDIVHEAYNINFYNLNASQQRQVLFMLSKTQTTDMIVLLGVLPLAVSTALRITKCLFNTAIMMNYFLGNE